MNQYLKSQRLTSRVVFVLIILVTSFLLTGCKEKRDDLLFTFPETVTCNASVVDYVEVETDTTFDDLSNGYLYSYVYDYGQFLYVFYNPEAEYEKDQYITKGAYGNKFFNSEGAFLQTEIPEGYILYSVTYKYTSLCQGEDDEATIATNLEKSVLYFSQEEVSESEFWELHPELLD